MFVRIPQIEMAIFISAFSRHDGPARSSARRSRQRSVVRSNERIQRQQRTASSQCSHIDTEHDPIQFQPELEGSRTNTATTVRLVATRTHPQDSSLIRPCSPLQICRSCTTISSSYSTSTPILSEEVSSRTLRPTSIIISENIAFER